jgi:hypothetical protein
MTSLQECSARAALCRRLATLEPDSRQIWLAEAKRWSRLTKENGEEAEALRHRDAGLSALWFFEPGGNRGGRYHALW